MLNFKQLVTLIIIFLLQTKNLNQVLSFNIFLGNVLQPSSSTILSPTSSFSTNNNEMGRQQQQVNKQVAIGSTWSNVNFDFDNIMGKKDTKGPAPSMNQLKSANTSPIKTPSSANSNFAFQQQTNNNFGQFNAFQ